MRILITGSEGNVGSTLEPYLQSKGHITFGVDIVQRFADNYKVVDINHPMELMEVFRDFKPDVCYHLAAMVSRVTCEDSPSLTIQTNVSGTNNVIQLCRIYRVRLFYFSSSEVYGNIGGVLSEERRDLVPNNIYAISKLMGESLVNYNITYGLKAIILRPFMMYHEGEKTGDHHSALIRFCDGLIRRQKITVHKRTVRSWMHIDDAIQVFELLLHAEGNHTVNVGNPNVCDTELMAQIICNILQIDYSDYVIETELPERMTLTKIPDLQWQTRLTDFHCQVPIKQGIDRVIAKMLSQKT